MPKRTIELQASMNAAGYKIALIVNGKEFTGEHHKGCGTANVYYQIDDQVKAVYGDLYEEGRFREFQDIITAMDAIGEIESAMLDVLTVQRGVLP